MGHNARGFSLLEMAVVTVTIGMIAGAILAGQELGRRSELRSVIVDASTYVMAIESFKSKYAALPGDMPTATQFWGRADQQVSGGIINTATNCEHPEGAVSVGKTTCNGNGDGLIKDGGEEYRAWQHLYASDYLTTPYKGIVAPPDAVGDAVPGMNVPAGKRENTGFSMFSAGLFSNNGNSTYFDGDYNNAMVYGAAKKSDLTLNPALKTKEAREIDGKLDDKYPSTGSVRSIRASAGATPECVRTEGSQGVFYYDETKQDLACALIFMNTFKRQRQN